jgi:cbb3-type cytochrome oxidase maturation protein
MNVIFLLIAASSVVAGVFLAGFIWAVKNGQYEDDRSPAVRMLAENDVPSTPTETK